MVSPQDPHFFSKLSQTIWDPKIGLHSLKLLRVPGISPVPQIPSSVSDIPQLDLSLTDFLQSSDTGTFPTHIVQRDSFFQPRLTPHIVQCCNYFLSLPTSADKSTFQHSSYAARTPASCTSAITYIFNYASDLSQNDRFNRLYGVLDIVDCLLTYWTDLRSSQIPEGPAPIPSGEVDTTSIAQAVVDNSVSINDAIFPSCIIQPQPHAATVSSIPVTLPAQVIYDLIPRLCNFTKSETPLPQRILSLRLLGSIIPYSAQKLLDFTSTVRFCNLDTQLIDTLLISINNCYGRTYRLSPAVSPICPDALSCNLPSEITPSLVQSQSFVHSHINYPKEKIHHRFIQFQLNFQRLMLNILTLSVTTIAEKTRFSRTHTVSFDNPIKAHADLHQDLV